jgi:hypothetical protein
LPDSGPSAVQFTGGSRARQLSASARIRLGIGDRARSAKPIPLFQSGSEPGERLLENRDRFFLTCHFPGVMWRHTARGVMPLLTGQVERRGLIGQRVRIRRRGRSVGGSRPTCLCRVFSPPRGKIEPGILRRVSPTLGPALSTPVCQARREVAPVAFAVIFREPTGAEIANQHAGSEGVAKSRDWHSPQCPVERKSAPSSN